MTALCRPPSRSHCLTFWHLGDEVVGTVVGSHGQTTCSRLPVGTRVWANLGVVAAGARAGAVAIPGAHNAIAPMGMSDTAAATLPLVGVTVLQAFEYGSQVFTPTHHAANRSVTLLTSGTGGTGTVGIQIARSLGASHVATTAGGMGDAALLRQLGADSVFDYHTPLLSQIEVRAGRARTLCLAISCLKPAPLASGWEHMPPFGRQPPPRHSRQWWPFGGRRCPCCFPPCTVHPARSLPGTLPAHGRRGGGRGGTSGARLARGWL